jgi:fucose 4-O-acetylase-like acetyltransferase
MARDDKGGAAGFNRSGRERIAFLDAARGIGILLVVIGHVERGLVSAGIAKGAVWPLFDTALYTFHMPLFMMLAGMNVPGSLRRGVGSFIRDKLQSVAYPYVLWSLVQGTILVLLSRFTNRGANWHDLLAIGWRPMSQFWFLYALMAYLLLVALIGLRIWVLIAAAAIVFLSGLALPRDGIGPALCFFLPFFVVGILVSERVKALSLRFSPLWLAALALLWLAALQLVDLSRPYAYLTVSALPCALLGSAFVLVLAQGLPQRTQAAWAVLGRMSMTIYVLHILAAAGTRIIMVRLGIHAPGLVYLAAGTIAGMALPCVAHLVLARLGLLPLFGLGKNRTGVRHGVAA